MSHLGLDSVPDWETTLVGNLVESQDLIQMETTGTVEEACMKLIKNQISSIPLHDPKSDTYLGLFDLNDLVKHISLCVSNSGQNTPTDPGFDISHYYNSKKIKEFGLLNNKLVDSIFPETTVEEEVEEATREKQSTESGLPKSRKSKGATFLSNNVLKLSDISTMDPFYTVLPETTLSQVIEVFASRLHRVAVMSDSGSIDGILSQSTVNEFLIFSLQKLKTENIHDEIPGTNSSLSVKNDPDKPLCFVKPTFQLNTPNRKSFESNSHDISESPSWAVLNDFVNKSLEEHKIDEKCIWAVTTSTPVTSALYLFEHYGFSSLLVLGSQNDVVGSISTSDIKYLIMPEFRYLINQPCLVLLQKIRQYEGIIKGKDTVPLFTVHSTASLKSVMVKLAVTGSHRVWIVDSSNSDDQHLHPSGQRSSVDGKIVSPNRKSSVNDPLRAPIQSSRAYETADSPPASPAVHLSQSPLPSPLGLNLLDSSGATLKLPPPTLYGSRVVGVVSLTDVFTVLNSLIVHTSADSVDFSGLN
ncbi:hypothetical protein BB560_006159 [Smittium megazygosporum]|uniref:CBS domain-containing protein n=1 Tax=Smittium megazygosporum TaxID=133381 RepID=A0A2T9YF73_9FUNG|nr:hypothetical protein BB560_006159 [Smittium megazygosporum]